MSSLKPVCVSCPAADRQAGPKQADLPPPNLSSMLIINPTYSTLPVSLHHKLTFFFFSFPSLSFSVLFSLTPPPFLLPSSLLQQICSRENNWWWGVWEKQELLPGAGRTSHGRHESAKRCSTVSIYLFFNHFPSFPQFLLAIFLHCHCIISHCL